MPLLGVLAVSLTLAPAMSYADDGRRHQQHNYSKQERKAYKNKQAYKQRHAHDRHEHKKLKHHKHKHVDHRQAHSHDWRSHIGHKHGHYKHYWKHDHGYREHKHHVHKPHVQRYTREYVNERRLQHYLTTDSLRFMLGLHGDNFDIIIRD